MDTSIEYAQMCHCAEEIQSHRKSFKEWKMATGDIFMHEDRVHMYAGIGSVPNKDVIWLPTQDQLQQMVQSEAASLVNRLRKFFDTVTRPLSIQLTVIAQQSETYEQMWLQYVMYCKYKKIWDRFSQQWII